MKLTYTLFLLLLSVGTYAQSPGITGTVTDGQGKPLASATVSLLRAKDSTLVKLAVSSPEGKFEFISNRTGRYLVSATLVGYAKSYSAPFDMDAESIHLGAIKLPVSAGSMNEVTVIAKKPFIESKIDRTVVNVDASPTSAGASAMDILEKSPGVTVSSDGSISLRGKEGVVVMMDGKPTYLSAADLANLLKNTPASALDQIEIMTNPSARYDASGNSGIINIKTKKGRAAGFNGNVTLGGTAAFFNYNNTVYVLPRSQNSFNFNYHKNKLNFFGSYNPNLYRGRSVQTIDRNFYSGNTLSGSSDLVTLGKYGNFNENLKLGLDYAADKKNTFGIVVSGFAFDGHPTPTTASQLKDDHGVVQSTLNSLTQNKTHFRNFTGNLNWRHTFDTSGRELTADLDYVVYGNTSNLLLTTYSYDASGAPSGYPLYLNGHLPSDISIWSFKSDYSQPLKNGRLEAGVKSSIVTNDNLVDYTRQVSGGGVVADSRSNHFIYDENINAAYVNVSKQYNKWSVQAGLRLENTNAKGRQVTNDSTFTRNFTNLFPSVFVGYAFNKDNQLTISYSRRITRPNYQDLNPFTYFLDSLTYYVGNPYLLPQFTHNGEISYAFRSQLIVTLNYSSTSDVISQIIKQNSSTKVTYNTPENISHFTNMGLSVTLPISFSAWWKTNMFLNVYNNSYTGIYNTVPIDLSYTSFTGNLTNTITLDKKKGFTGEISGFYRHKSISQLAIVDPLYQVSLGLQKQILQGKGSIRLNVRDPFAWQKYNSMIRYSDVDVRAFSRNESRAVTATFTWRFGKSQGQQPRRRTSGSQDEQNRVGGGG